MPMTLSELMGTPAAAPDATVAQGRGVTLSELTGAPAPERTFLGDLKGFLTDPESWKGMGATAGKTALGAADLILGIPGQALAVGAGLGGRIAATAAGESRKIQDLASEAGHELIPEWATQPLQTAAKILGVQQLDQSIVTKAMDKVGELSEKVTKGLITQGAAKDLLEAFMVAGGARGTDAGVKYALEPKGRPAAGARESYKAPEVAPEEQGVAPPSRPGPPAIDITTAKQVREIFKKAKEAGAPDAVGIQEVLDLFKKAKEPQVEAPPAPEVPTPIGSQVGTVPKTSLTPEGVTLEEARLAADRSAAPPTELEIAKRKLQNGEGATLTATEKISLRSAMQKGTGLIDRYGQPLAGVALAAGIAELVKEDPEQATSLGLGLAALGTIRMENAWRHIHEFAEGTRVELENGQKGKVIGSQIQVLADQDAQIQLIEKLHDQAYQGVRAGQLAQAQGDLIFRKLQDTHAAQLGEMQKGRLLPVLELDDGRKVVAHPMDITKVFEGPQKGAADPKLLAGIAAGVAAGAYLLTSPDRGELAMAGLGLGLALKGKSEPMLLEAIRKGGKEGQHAATELYRQNAPRTLRMLESKFGRQGVDVESVLQEGMLRAMRDVATGTFRGDSKFSTYLHTAVVREAIDSLRRAEVRPETVSLTEDPATGRSGLAETLGHQETPEKAALNNALGGKLNAALERIDPRFKEAFLAIEAEGMSYEEAAAHFGVPEGTIKSRVGRAKEALQGYLREYRDTSLGATEVPENRATRPAERGTADPRVLANVALLGGGAALGAYLDKDAPLTGAAWGAGVGLLLANAHPRAWVEAVKRAQNKGELVRIDELTAQTAYEKKVFGRAVDQMANRIIETVADPARRSAIYHYLTKERPISLSPTELKTAKEAADFLERLGGLAKDAGVVKVLLDDYATRIYEQPTRSFFEGRRVGGGMQLESPFGKPRGYKTLAEAEAAGYVLKTDDIARVLTIYSDATGRAIANNRFIETLRETALPDGTKLVQKEGKAPSEFVFVDAPQLRGLRVHPDIAADLRFVFDSSNPGAILGALDAINSTQKRLGVSLSLFHATALEHAMLGATSIFKSPIRGVRVFGQSFMPAVFGESLAVKMIREGGAGDLIDSAMKDGVEFSRQRHGSVVAEERPGIYKGLETATMFLDKTVPGLGKYSTGAVLALNHIFDDAMWARFHTTLKIETYADKVSELSRNNARMVEAGKEPLKSRAEIGRAAASFTNDLYGGLNYQQIVGEFSSRWGRELASAALSPTGRFGMRLALFAPDWTISTTRAFVKAFGPRESAVIAGGILGSQIDPENKGVGGFVGAGLGLAAGMAGGLKGTPSGGFRGLLHPTELADLHRQYIMRSAFLYTAIADTLNYQMSGQHFWDNKDPTRLDRGDGTTMQLSKHFMEPFHWLLDPRKQAMGKASFLVKETASQLGDVEYWSPKGAPRMGGVERGKDVSIGTRLGHMARQFTPISAQGFESANPQKAAWSMAGMPVYGKTLEERAAAKAESKRLAVQRRIDKRLSEQSQ